MDASVFAADDELFELCDDISLKTSNTNGEYINDQTCKVFVWGLNDKEQLAGLKGSKIKYPTFSASISQLRPIYICGGSKSLFIVAQDGKVS